MRETQSAISHALWEFVKTLNEISFQVGYSQYAIPKITWRTCSKRPKKEHQLNSMLISIILKIVVKDLNLGMMLVLFFLNPQHSRDSIGSDMNVGYNFEATAYIWIETKAVSMSIGVSEDTSWVNWFVNRTSERNSKSNNKVLIGPTKKYFSITHVFLQVEEPQITKKT